MQLNLFTEQVIRKLNMAVVKKYNDLTIHEKINVRANSCGFGMNFYNAVVMHYSGTIKKYEHPECLHARYEAHYKSNYTISYNTKNWREAELKKQLKLFKQ